MKKFLFTMFLSLLIGHTNLSSFTYITGTYPQYQISSVAGMHELADSVNAGNTYEGIFFELTNDIYGVGKMLGDDFNYFAGNFNGNNYRIEVGITNPIDANVGLFSCLDGSASISNLTVSGFIMGMAAQNVGGFVGQIRSGYVSFNFCTNLADIFGMSSASSVGGIVGTITNPSPNSIYKIAIFNSCVNNGTISGNKYVGGILGSHQQAQETLFCLCWCRNAGTLQTIGTPDAMGGIIGYADLYLVNSNYDIAMCVNIGDIFSQNSQYAGGIAGYADNTNIMYCSNSGPVYGAVQAVGGILGSGMGSSIIECINTNWIEPTTMWAGAILGQIGPMLQNCHYDISMVSSSINGIGGYIPNMLGQVEGQIPHIMRWFNGPPIGNSLPLDPIAWEIKNHRYPYPRDTWSGISHPINLLSAAWIDVGWMYQINTIPRMLSFQVSNNNPPAPQQPLFSYPDYPQFQWFSLYGKVNILKTSTTADVIGIGPDILEVKLMSSPANQIYGKRVPVNIP